MIKFLDPRKKRKTPYIRAFFFPVSTRNEKQTNISYASTGTRQTKRLLLNTFISFKETNRIHIHIHTPQDPQEKEVQNSENINANSSPLIHKTKKKTLINPY